MWTRQPYLLRNDKATGTRARARRCYRTCDATHRYLSSTREARGTQCIAISSQPEYIPRPYECAQRCGHRQDSCSRMFNVRVARSRYRRSPLNAPNVVRDTAVRIPLRHAYLKQASKQISKQNPPSSNVRAHQLTSRLPRQKSIAARTQCTRHRHRLRHADTAESTNAVHTLRSSANACAGACHPSNHPCVSLRSRLRCPVFPFPSPRVLAVHFDVAPISRARRL